MSLIVAGFHGQQPAGTKESCQRSPCEGTGACVGRAAEDGQASLGLAGTWEPLLKAV